MPTPSVKVFSVIVIYNGMRRDWIKHCFDSLLASGTPTEIVAIDNCSKDDSVSFIRAHYPTVQLIASKENLGFAKANNVGIKMAMDANADFVFLLNQDAWLLTTTDLTRLVNVSLANPQYGVLSPIVLTGDATDLDYSFKTYTAKHNYNYPQNKDREDILEVPFVNAAAWLLPRHCFTQVGGFNTALFQHYGEDDNYVQRVTRAGLKTAVVGGSFVCHDTLSASGVNPDFRSKMKWIETKVSVTDINLTERQRLVYFIKLCKIQMFHGNSSFANLKQSWKMIFRLIGLYFTTMRKGRSVFVQPG